LPDLRSGIIGFAKKAKQSAATADLVSDKGLSKNSVKNFAAEYLPFLSDLFALYLPSGL
jgi:hypothetical protein